MTLQPVYKSGETYYMSWRFLQYVSYQNWKTRNLIKQNSWLLWGFWGEGQQKFSRAFPSATLLHKMIIWIRACFCQTFVIFLTLLKTFKLTILASRGQSCISHKTFYSAKRWIRCFSVHHINKKPRVKISDPLKYIFACLPLFSNYLPLHIVILQFSS